MELTENEVLALHLILFGAIAVCGGMALLYRAIWKHYRRKRIERERTTAE